MLTNAPDIDAARTLFRTGRFSDLVRVSLPFVKKGGLTPEHRSLVAKAMIYAGDTSGAVAIAEDANQPHADPFVRSACELVLGIAAGRSGDPLGGGRRLQEAARLAREAGDVGQEAWSHVHRVRLAVQSESQEAVNARFVEARRLITKAADPHLTAYLHDSVAVLDSQKGRLEEARRHLDLALSLLDRHPNAWIQQVVQYSLLCLAGIRCSMAEALLHAENVRKLAEVTGGYGIQFALDVNEAHLNIVSGRFARAYGSLSRVLRVSRALPKFAAAEELARIHLALNSPAQCETALSILLEADRSLGVAECYLGRCATVVRTKLLIRERRPEAAVEHAARARIQAANAGDHGLVATLAALQAEALAGTGATQRAGVKLLEAAEAGATEVREYLGQYYDVCSRVLDASECAAAPLLRDRARRIWRAQGNVWARVESDSRGGPELPIRDMTPDMFPNEEPPSIDYTRDARLTAACVLDAACAALDLSSDSRLVAAELTGVATALGCADHVRVVDATQNSARRPPRGEHYVAVLSTADRKRTELRCSPAADPLTNIALGNILRLARAAAALAQARLDERNRAALWPAEAVESDDSLFISDEMRTLAATARKVAPTNVTVLITGETGTGKEILARAIHAASARAKAAFLPFNCSAGPRDMIDTQLFGHRRGAFTGATEHAPGIIRAAGGGTLFLDEIGEAPLEVQPKLLRFLESGEIHPVGEPMPARVDVRVIAATNVDVDAAVSSGRFREDLFYRLNIVRLHVPPLRERRVEIPVFAQHYLRKYARELAKGDLRLAKETVEYLLLYKWPGNVRQLANEMRRMVALAETDAVLMPEHLSHDIVASRRTIPASERTLDPNEIVVRLDQPLAAATEHLERVMIPYVLRHCDGRVEEAARRLGLSRKGLYLKRMRLGLEAAGPHVQTA